MFSSTYLLIFILAGGIGWYWWRSGLFKGHARSLAQQHCQQLELQLLDQSMVIVGLWPIRNSRGRFVFRRSYQFEFASAGDRRYQGRLVMEGMNLASIQLDTYKIPGAE